MYYMMLLRRVYNNILVATLIASSYCSLSTRDVTKANAETAYTTLQKWYDTTTGLWIPSTGWWNSANCLNVIADLAKVDRSVRHDITRVISNTYTNAQKYNLQMTKLIGVGSNQYLMQTYYTHSWPYLPKSVIERHGEPKIQTCSGFLNDYYDDEGWWALAWVAAYDITHEPRYLWQAQLIFDDMRSVFGKTNCSVNNRAVGGIWWNKKHEYVNAIANELFFSVAASLANRVGYREKLYLSIAKQQWAWFKGSGMISANSTINDGLDQQTCQNNGGTVWTYNQGVVLGGLVELSKATNDESYIDFAHTIAEAALTTLAPGGILKEPCEPNCGADGAQFKGILVRNLRILHQASPKARYRVFIDNNANSIWVRDRNDGNQLSIKWAGPFVSPGNASTQSSAMDCLIASLVV